MPQIHVISRIPGRIRGGRPTPPHAAYDLGAHTPDELRDLLTDHEITVVYCEAVTEEAIVALEAKAALAADVATAEIAAGADAKKKAGK